MSNLTPDSDLFGLLYGFSFQPDRAGQEIGASAALEQLRTPRPGHFLWLHLNLAHASCERWLKSNLDLPEEFFEALHEGSRSTRIEQVDSALLAVVNDVVFDFNRVSTDTASLWVCVRQGLIITARHHPLRSVDRLRASVKRGEHFRSPMELLIHLVRDQGDVLSQFMRTTSLSVDRIEDELLAQRISQSRSELGAMRRILVRLQRLLALEPGSLMRLLHRPPAWLHEEDLRELRQSTEESALVINDITALGERIKLLQEEIATNLSEQSNRTLFTLTVVTVLALPINIVAGFFGMNVGGVPLSSDPHGFWILVALVATFTVIAGRWAFRKRD